MKNQGIQFNCDKFYSVLKKAEKIFHPTRLCKVMTNDVEKIILLLENRRRISGR